MAIGILGLVGDYFGVFSGPLPTNSLVVPTGYTTGNFIQGTTTLSASTPFVSGTSINVVVS